VAEDEVVEEQTAEVMEDEVVEEEVEAAEPLMNRTGGRPKSPVLN
jgi:hypothetical protein